MKEKIKHSIVKLQGLPEHQKKFIFLAVMAVSVVAMFFVALSFTKTSAQRIRSSLVSFNQPASVASSGVVPEDFMFSDPDGTGETQDDLLPTGLETNNANLLRHTSEPFGFSINYPANLTVANGQDNGFFGVTLQDNKAQGDNVELINICPKVCFTKPNDFSQNKLVRDSKPMAIDGVSAKIYVSEKDFYHEAFVYFLESPTPKFAVFQPNDISAGGWFAIKMKNRDLLDQIINSFAFIR